MLLDLVTVIPKIPCNFKQFDNKRGGPLLAIIASTEPNEVSFLNTGPLDSDAAFKESTDTILGVDGLGKVRHVGVHVRERLGASPFCENLNNPVGDFFGGVN